MMNNIPLGRFGTESDIAAVVYLASNASSMITGSSLVIDGGWTATIIIFLRYLVKNPPNHWFM